MPGLKPYVVRPPTSAEWAVLAMGCADAQEEYWGVVGKRQFEWTDEFIAKLKSGKLLTLGAFDGTNALVGSMICDLRAKADPPTVFIWGMASGRRLPKRERLCVYYSLLLGACPYCEELGLTHGSGEVEASNDLLLETFETIRDQFKRATLEPSGTFTELTEKRTASFTVTVGPLDESYRQGLLRCIEEL